MTILFHSTFKNKEKWKIKIQKKFKNKKIISIHNRKDFDDVDIAIIWNLPKLILKKLKNLKIIFSLGAGVDHILKLDDYKNIPIIRIKDPLMGELMYYYVQSQILNYQVGNNQYSLAQRKKKWRSEILPTFSSELTVGIIGMGFLGFIVGNYLIKNNYNVIGYKKSTVKKSNIKIFTGDGLYKLLALSDVVINILPSTKDTEKYINKKIFSRMKKKVLFINIGRGSTVNEKDLISFLKKNKESFASLDVFQTEPLSKNSQLWTLPNVSITPHVASITLLDSAIDLIYKNYLRFKKNKKIQSDVDLNKGY
ncbi:NAD(P)-binding domain-containing protein [Pelagibacteraceae bacterium]|nr:NAD(P)-binding domain-containing protein [Pelagibacteraceae bacterium]